MGRSTWMSIMDKFCPVKGSLTSKKWLPGMICLITNPADVAALINEESAAATSLLGSRLSVEAIPKTRSNLEVISASIVRNAICLVAGASFRSEEHTSELQSRENLVCRLLLEKKNI